MHARRSGRERKFIPGSLETEDGQREDFVEGGQAEAAGDLLAPEVLFPELDEDEA